MNRTWRRFILVTFLLTATACGSSGPQFAEVDGILLVQGQPHDRINIQFHPNPDRGTRGPSSSATTDAQGRFRLVYDSRSTNDLAGGAVVGWHRVVLADYSRFEDGSGRTVPPSKIPERYMTILNTPLDIEIKPGKQTITVEVR